MYTVKLIRNGGKWSVAGEGCHAEGLTYTDAYNLAVSTAVLRGGKVELVA